MARRSESLTSSSTGVPERLGSQLRDVRALRGETLRAVATATNISAAYLLKLEQGSVATPSPHMLLNLARHYEISYLGLMQLAGYATEDGGMPERRPAGVLAEALAGQDLTPEEERAMAAFLSSLRAR